jgi:cytidine deaminase
MEDYKTLISIAIDALKDAITIRGSKVGVAIEMNDGSIFTGFNIESRGAPIIHAELVGVISALKAGYKPENFKTIAIICNFPGIFPSCASCRQFLWEHTNPDLMIVVADPSTGNGGAFRLRDLYPLPFPAETIKTEDNTVNSGVTSNEQEKDERPVTESVIANVPKRVRKRKGG